ncbi:hypothetical protein [Qipengyuania sp. ASV99]|uniref:hypothetical protein n=1 Tax=Qipengyuania sp. ASV99 TaxID=3399681 RepID=UPI003A4C8100
MFALFAAALVLPGLSTAPAYNPGDAFVFSNGRVERVVAAEDDRITWSGLTGTSYERSRSFFVPILAWRRGRGTGMREVRGNPERLWPMTQPKTVRFRAITETRTSPMANAKRSVSLWVCKTNREKSITVQAGTFAAVPVLCDRYSTTTMRLIERRGWDYAPELGHYVRRTSINYLRGTNTSIELVAALTGPAATTARLTALARRARQSAAAQRR